ncbi:MAG TPA: hypothetical protein PKD83_00055 [Ignavibacteria bacterium]|nr:hypothetical protein [Ignavibacteria bacterium]
MILILFLNVNYLAVYYTLYVVNTESLTKSCCEMIVDNCNAHCYLDKKMSEESDSKNGITVEMKLKLSEFQISKENSNFNNSGNHKFVNGNSKLMKTLFFPKIEHPPRS